MRRIIFTLVLILSLSTGLQAQYYSRVKPTLVVWQANDHKVSLRRGLYGIDKPTSLNIILFFSPKMAQYYSQQGVILQFRWYYYLSTRRKLVKVENVPFSRMHKNPDGSYSLSSTLKTIQPGWWEVQVVSSLDRRYIQFAGLDRFQILIKSRAYTMR